MVYTRVSGVLDERFSGETPEVHPKLPFSGRKVTTHDFPNPVSAFEKHGWKIIGSGIEAMVFVSDKHPGKVLKVFGASPGYIDFYSLVKKSDNPHFPVVSKMGSIAIPLKVSPYERAMIGLKSQKYKLNVVLVEQLFKLKRNSLNHKLIKETKNYLSGHRWEFDPKISPSILKAYPQWKNALDSIVTIMKEKSRFDDIHWGNIMQRADGFPVITDPLR